MKPFVWNIAKNLNLQMEWSISFEAVVGTITMGSILDIVEHHNPELYPNQRVFVMKIKDYAWLVPFVETDEEIFLKTVIPSRKATKKYLRNLQ